MFISQRGFFGLYFGRLESRVSLQPISNQGGGRLAFGLSTLQLL
jgi:hypothetical protein